jgi:hypothetical protein
MTQKAKSNEKTLKSPQVRVDKPNLREKGLNGKNQIGR